MKTLIEQSFIQDVRHFAFPIKSPLFESPLSSAKSTFFNYKATLLDNVKSKDWKVNLIAFIGSEYRDSNLTLKMVVRHIAKNEKFISNFLMENYQMSFKEYLNNIRLHEAKRLIKNEHLSFKEIAYLVGYANANHFSRVFKQYFKISPSDYRKFQLSIF